VPTTPTKAQLRALPKKQRREVARQVAREQRLAEQRRLRRRRITVRVVAAVAVLAVVAGAALGVRAWVHGRNRGPANMASDGILLSGYQGQVFATRNAAVPQGGTPTASIPSRELGVLDTVFYVDYSDPDAATLWSTAGAALTAGVQAESVSLEIHPIAPDGSASAVAAAAGMACVAELAPDSALQANDALLTGGQDWTPSTVQAALTKAGVKADGLSDCLTSGRFTGWVHEATARAKTSVPFDLGHVTGTTMLMAGTAYTGAPDDRTAFAQALSDAQAVIASDSKKLNTGANSPTGGATASPTDGATATPTDGATGNG
jgi:hypothetical protein